MDINQIPKSFWHAASVSLLALTFGFIFISYKFGDLQVKFMDLEMRSTTVIALEQTLEEQRKNIEKQEAVIASRAEEVHDLNVLLEQKLKEIDRLKDQVASLQTAGGSAEHTREVAQQLEQISNDDEFDKKVAEKRSAQTTLINKQEKLENDYNTQKKVFQQIQQQAVPFQQQQLQQQQVQQQRSQ